jgi:hairy-and-enhancer-of-split protein
MAPIIAHYKNHYNFDDMTASSNNVVEEAPVSRTHQYRKVMKPLLERKRRARINKYLDDIKDLMVCALQSEGESITKLEKADVLELTVRHLQKLKRQQQLQANPSLDMDRYRSGYTACAAEVSRFMATVPGVDISFGTHLMGHLGSTINNVEQRLTASSAPLSPSASSDCGYRSDSGRDSSSPAASIGSPAPAKSEIVWRPF